MINRRKIRESEIVIRGIMLEVQAQMSKDLINQILIQAMPRKEGTKTMEKEIRGILHQNSSIRRLPEARKKKSD